MILKGGSVKGGALGEHLEADENEVVEIVAIDNLLSADIAGAVAELRAHGSTGRTAKPIFHIAVSAAPGERWDEADQQGAIAAVLEEYGLQGQPVLVVRHQKDANAVGRDAHLHIVASRVAGNGKVISDSYSRVRNEKISRCLEFDLGHRLTVGRHNRAVIARLKSERRDVSAWMSDLGANTVARPLAELSHAEAQQEKRTRLTKAEVARIVATAWQGSDSHSAFAAALAESGFRLARGRNEVMIVDAAGGQHALNRLLSSGFKAAGLQSRMANLRAAISSRIDPGKLAPLGQVYSFTSTAGKDTAAARVTLSPEAILRGLTARRSTFTEKQLDRAIQEVPVDRRATLKASILANPALVTLGIDGAGLRRMTTRSVAEIEGALRDDCAVMVRRHALAVDDHLLERGLQTFISEFRARTGHELFEEQSEAIKCVCGGPDLANITGTAGAGKSTMLEGAARIWGAAGLRVEGLALQAVTAARLTADTGIPANTIHSRVEKWDRQEGLARIRDSGRFEADSKAAIFSTLDRWAKAEDEAGRDGRDIRTMRVAIEMADRIGDLDRRTRRWLTGHLTRQLVDRIDARTVVVIDEAGMVPNQLMGRVVSHIRAAGGKLVAVGDTEQIQPIETGPAFRVMQIEAPSMSLARVVRQRDEWQREATQNFAAGDPERARLAVLAYAEAGQIRVNIGEQGDRTAACAELFADWRADLARDGLSKSRLIMAYTRDDVAALNSDARAAMREAGHLHGPDIHVPTEFLGEIGAVDIAVGDRLMGLRNDVSAQMQNGAAGTVTKIIQEQGGSVILSLAMDDGRRLDLDTGRYRDLQLAYASTIHKAQGATVDRSWVLAHRLMDRHIAYVSMSRHRESVRVFAAADDAQSVDGLARGWGWARSADAVSDWLDPRELLRHPDQAQAAMRQVIGDAATRVRLAGERIDHAIAKYFEAAGSASPSVQRKEQHLGAARDFDKQFGPDFSIPDLGEIAAGEAAASLNRVPSLSSVGLARDAGRASLLLPDHASDHLEHAGADESDGLRRPGDSGGGAIGALDRFEVALRLYRHILLTYGHDKAAAIAARDAVRIAAEQVTAADAQKADPSTRKALNQFNGGPKAGPTLRA